MPEPVRFRKRPVEITAIHFDGTNHTDVTAFTFGCFRAVDTENRGDDPEVVAQVFNQRYGAWIPVKAGMWIARDEHGYYPIKADRLAADYEAVGDD